MIERHVTTAISDAIVRENPAKEDTIELSVRRNRIRARLLSKPLPPPIKLRQTVVLPVGTTKKIRNLELNQMLAEARALVDTAGNRLAELENDRREATDLLTQINKPGFWDLIDHREEILDRYRTLDVAIRMRKRFAENESVLSRLLPDLARAWSKQPTQVDVSRIYGRDGVIHDPRTGVTSNRIKEVWKGGLDEFLEGWRRMKG